MNDFDEPETSDEFIAEAMKVVHAQAFVAGLEWKTVELAIGLFVGALELIGAEITGDEQPPRIDGVPFCGDCGGRME